MFITFVIVCLFVAMAVLSFFSNVLRAMLTAFFNLFRHKGSRDGTKSDAGQQTLHTRTGTRKKVYSRDEGEYVDFEEIKK